MKKLICVLTILLLFTGCAGLGKWTTGAQSVVDAICGPSEDAKLDAAKMIAAIQAGLQMGTDIYTTGGITGLDVSQALAVLSVIRDGGCFVASQLAAAFKVTDSINTQVAQAQLKLLKGSASVKPPEYSALRKYLK